MKTLTILFVLFTTIFCQPQQENNLQQVPLTQSTKIVFADSILAAKIVSTEDDFTKVLSAYDRSASMQSDKPVSHEVYMQHLAKNVLNWPDGEIKRFMAFIKNISPRLKELNLNLPQEIALIKTTSLESGGAGPAYTRQNAIMFTAKILSSSDSVLSNVLIHEIAHVYSRHNSDIQSKLYKIFGFRQSNDIVLPKEWADRRLSNPDAPALNTIIDVQHKGNSLALTPLLYARVPVYDTSKGGGIFQSFAFQMMQVEKKEGLWQPVFFDGNPVLYQASPKELPDFWRQIGENTNYIIHPEEIMASNFVHLVNKTSGLPNPEIIEKIEAVILQ
jgi:hypothetical protein